MTLGWLKRTGQDGDVHFGRMVGFSVVIHFFVLSSIIFSPTFPTPKWTFGPVYTVQLASLPGHMVGSAASSELSREILQPRTAAQHIILRKPVEKTAAVPIRKVETSKNIQNSGIQKALEAVRKKLETAPTVSPPTTAANQAVGAGVPNNAATGQMDSYYGEIWSKIRGQWSLPQGILSKGNVAAVINARILRNGAVTDIGFERRSGNRYFDESAVRAIRKASPLPPFPAWIRDNSIEIGIRFHSAEFR